jgi:hypothetical protein
LKEPEQGGRIFGKKNWFVEEFEEGRGCRRAERAKFGEK